MDSRNNKIIRFGKLALAAALIATLCLTSWHSIIPPGDVYAAQEFIVATQKPDIKTIYAKKGESLKVTGKFLSKGDKVLRYKSSKASVATISKKGMLKARRVGKTTLTLITKKGKKDTINLVVTKQALNARSIKINKTRTIKVKQVVRLKVKTSPAKTTSTVRWYSYNKKIATVDKAGYITGKKTGTVKIRAKTSNGKVAYCKLTVKDPVTISKKTASVRADRPEALKLTATAPSGKIVWSSSDKSVATVKNGAVVGKKAGKVDIIAKAKASGTIAKCKVTVSPHVKSTGISIAPAEDEIYATEKLTLKYTLVSEVEGEKSNDDVTWSSSDKKIATVSTKGVVTGVGYGVAKITAKSESGHAASAEIIVNTIKSKASKVIITPGMYYKTGFLLYGTDADSGVTYSSSDKSIATVTAEGNVYANLRDKSTGAAKAGTVTITAKTKSGDKASVKVVVRDEPTIIDISKWQGDIDWAKASKSVDLAILRVMYGADTTTELKYPSYADSCDEYGVPFAAYAYVTYKTKAAAEKQAKVFYEQAVSDGREPLFFVVDAEESYITRANTEAYIAKLRSLAKADGISRLKVGVYIGHHLYNSLNLNLKTDTKNSKTPDFVWIPRYNSNIGARTSSMSIPDFACDMWQYTSAGRIPGFSGNIDVNSLTDVDGEMLTEKTGFDFSWIVAGPEV